MRAIGGRTKATCPRPLWVRSRPHSASSSSSALCQ